MSTQFLSQKFLTGLLFITLIVSCGKDNRSGQSGTISDPWNTYGVNPGWGPGMINGMGSINHPVIQAALSQNFCKSQATGFFPGQMPQMNQGGVNRVAVQFPLTHLPPLAAGDVYLGVTSFGDVAAVISQGPGQSPLFVGYICDRMFGAGGQGQLVSNPSLQTYSPAQCQVKPITAATMVLPGNVVLNFRWADAGFYPNPNLQPPRMPFSFCAGVYPPGGF